MRGACRTTLSTPSFLIPQHAPNPRTTMATGWAGDNAVQDQIDATIKDAIQRARS
jgi:hypothetical protein